MTTKAEVFAVAAAHPKWDSVQIADHLDCLPEYVRATFARAGRKLPPKRTMAEKIADAVQEELLKRGITA